MESNVQSRNLSEDLSDEFLASQQGWNIPCDYKSLSERIHPCCYLKMISPRNGKSSGSNKASTSRNLNISNYFSRLYSDSFENAMKANLDTQWTPPLLYTVQPYRVDWSHLAMHIIQADVNQEMMLLAFNFALVCLAKVDTDLIKSIPGKDDFPKILHSEPLAEYIGLGIIRNIDVENKCFYILTPEPEERLNSVNALVKGNVELPSGYFNQNVPGCLAYLSPDISSIQSKFAGKAKPRFNLKRKPSKMKNSMEIN